MPDVFDEAIRQANHAMKTLAAIRKALGDLRKLPCGDADASIDILERKVGALEKALRQGSLETTIPQAGGALEQIRSRLDELKKQRSDARRRREEFARLARERGWSLVQTASGDYTGPFKLEHTEKACTLRFGRFLLKRLSYPSPIHLADAIVESTQQLEAEARRGWSEFIARAAEAQEKLSPVEPVPWKELVQAAIPDAKQSSRLKRSLCYRLAMLMSSRGLEGWGIAIAPPNLAEQREAWTVPRLDRPNESVRVFRVRLLSPPSANRADADNG